MSLDVYLTRNQPVTVYSDNITHNLGPMAKAAGIYMHLWRPEEIGIVYARDLIAPLREGLLRLHADPDHFRTFDSANGWGVYQNLVAFVASYLRACEECPDATVEASR